MLALIVICEGWRRKFIAKNLTNNKPARLVHKARKYLRRSPGSLSSLLPLEPCGRSPWKELTLVRRVQTV